MGVDVQPSHPSSNPHGCEFGFLLFILKNSLWGSPPPLSFQKKLGELNTLHTLHLPILWLLGISLCEVLEHVARFTTSPSSSKKEFV
jgi:hypothetical protein